MRLIALLFAALLAGCASQSQLDTWQGASLEELVMTYGTPKATTDLGNGKKAVEFEFAPHQSRYHCRAWFMLGMDGKVTDARMDGNIGGCSNLVQARN